MAIMARAAILVANTEDEGMIRTGTAEVPAKVE